MRVIDLFSAAKVLAGDWVRIVPLMPQGYWRVGEQRPPIDEDNLRALAANFEVRSSRGLRTSQIPLNIEHDEAGGRIGWISEMKAVLDGPPEASGVYAKLELTEAGRKRLEAGEFAYLSPEIVWAFHDPDTNENVGPVVVGLAATNYPYFGDRTAMFTREAKDHVEAPFWDAVRAMGWRTEDLSHLLSTDKIVATASVLKSLDETQGRSLLELFAVTRRAGDGKDYPASAYIIVPDPQKPSTWKLRIKEYVSGSLQVTRSILSMAAQAVGPSGFRGQKVQLSAQDMAKAKSRILAEYRKLGVAKEDIPKHLFSKGDNNMEELTLTRDDLTLLQRIGSLFSRDRAPQEPPAEEDGAMEQMRQDLDGLREEMTTMREGHQAELASRDQQITGLRQALDAAQDVRLTERFTREAQGYTHLGAESAEMSNHLRWLFEADEGGEHYQWFVTVLETADRALEESAAFTETGSTHPPSPSSPAGEMDLKIRAKAQEMYGQDIQPGDERYISVVEAVAREDPGLYSRATKPRPAPPRPSA